MKIKICGVTTVDDALMAAEAGADLVGLNFYHQSPRHVEPRTAGEISAALRALPRPPVLVGVFVDEPAERMKAILDDCGLDLAQLSGDESLHILEAMGPRAFKAIRAIEYVPPLRNPVSRTSHCPDFLLDSHVPGYFGGTGRTTDWDQAAELARPYQVLLAGGLVPMNVGEAIRRVRPWGVDVASGVEREPGKKDSAKVIAFIRRAREAQETEENISKPSRSLRLRGESRVFSVD